MNWFEKCVYGLYGTMTEPIMYGWFHILALAIMFAVGVFLCWKCRNVSDKKFRIIIGVAWAIMLLFEIYKQVEFSFNYDELTGSVRWDYEWYAFPFQLCSTPLYLLPFIVFLPDGKVRNSIIAFIGSFALFGGLATMVFPTTVFIETIGINIQTMVHHGLQVVIGVFALVHERLNLSIKYFRNSIWVYFVMIAIAIGLNYLMKGLIDETFNMFYINAWDNCDLPLIGDVIKPKVPYLVFLALYVFGFILIAFVVFMIVYGIIKCCDKKVGSSNKNNMENENLYSYQKQQAKEKDKTYSYQKKK